MKIFNLSIDSALVTDGDTIDFQLVDGSASATFDTVDTVPTLTVNIVASNITGTLDYTELDDTIAGTGTLENTGTVIVTELDDTITSSGTILVSGSLNYTEENCFWYNKLY